MAVSVWPCLPMALSSIVASLLAPEVLFKWSGQRLGLGSRALLQPPAGPPVGPSKGSLRVPALALPLTCSEPQETAVSLSLYVQL